MKIKIGLIALILLCSCATTKQLYQGEKRSEEDVVRVVGMDAMNPMNNMFGTSITEFDGKILDPSQSQLEFLPGRHTLVIQLTNVGIVDGKKTVTKEFKAGERYLIAIQFGGPNDKMPELVYKGNVRNQSDFR